MKAAALCWINVERNLLFATGHHLNLSLCDPFSLGTKTGNSCAECLCTQLLETRSDRVSKERALASTAKHDGSNPTSRRVAIVSASAMTSAERLQAMAAPIRP